MLSMSCPLAECLCVPSSDGRVMRCPGVPHFLCPVSRQLLVVGRVSGSEHVGDGHAVVRLWRFEPVEVWSVRHHPLVELRAFAGVGAVFDE